MFGLMRFPPVRTSSLEECIMLLAVEHDSWLGNALDHSFLYSVCRFPLYLFLCYSLLVVFRAPLAHHHHNALLGMGITHRPLGY